MSIKKLFLSFCIIALFTGGCLVGDSDKDDPKIGEINNINQLTMGGGVFIFREQGFGLAQFGTFNEIEPYEEATVYVNGVELANNGGIHSNAAPLSIETLTTEQSLRIAVYALGDSVVSDLAIPEDPVIVKPEEGVSVHAGDSLYVEVGFPGDPQYIAITLIDQEAFAVGYETEKPNSLLSLTIPGEKLPNTGTFPLNAYSINMSADKIPNNFNMNKQYEMFLAASVVMRNIEFTETE
ncbi:MAG: hypothetical protein HOC71_10960 [Candidatus Latescibacteria bacterium]|jgi:hypothetical protein|nr:hypothetical protein [Candidatus Latescibacterota bacterium]